MTTRNIFLTFAALTAAAVPSLAQSQRIRANIHGGGGEGKCTFEVEVDGAAEVEIRGSEGVVKTLRGAPARWIRLDCNEPLPNRTSSFRFKGIDGRGRQTLVRDPNSTGGMAVVRIEDRDNGRERYTGDIIWRGGSGGGGFDGPRGGFDGPRGRIDDRRRVSRSEASDICRAEVSARWRVDRRKVGIDGLEQNRDGVTNLRFDFEQNRDRRRGFCSVSPIGEILSIRLDGERDRDRGVYR